ncbi:MAG TPA: Uma2 family endonuclease [Pseudonocardiaceae bacterium]|nr:Uma2 family endonuclease [Pseudonocardiaceae bacterium]
MTDESGSFARRHGGPLTVRDLQDMPDDGNRYELMDGELYKSPPGTTRHQQIVVQLGVRLEATRPPGMAVLPALAVVLNADTEVQPDLLAAPVEAFTKQNLPGPPSLAVEVLSPDSLVIDLSRKKEVYQRFGVPSYWVIDPLEPSLLAFELDENGRYQTVAEVAGDKLFEATTPFPVRFVLTELLGPFA